ncbi:MAG: alcohol dehydrogenase catalytic domain-containing protein [Deltaproteobacteria bacterium]|nr:alcohol dehydrogenase catalytic domain-containing protein [Deltaproteobacteria bacterium]
MKAVVKAEPQPGIRLEDIPVPTVGPEEVLIRVKAVGLCGSDVHIYEWAGGFEHLKKYLPMVLGHEFAGEVVEAGNRVSGFHRGDRVTSETGRTCGRCVYCLTGKMTLCDQRLGLGRIGIEQKGAMAEYVLCHGSLLHRIPEGVSFEEAAMSEPTAVALNALDQVEIFPGDCVVVLGAGPIALTLAQGAKAAGAFPVVVTGLTQDQSRLSLARALGADETIDVEKADPVAKAKDLTGGLGPAKVFEVSGSARAFNQGLDMVRKGGVLVAVGIYPENISVDVTRRLVREMKAIRGVFGGSRLAWSRALHLMGSGKIRLAPLITHRLPLEKADQGFRACLEKKAMKVILFPDSSGFS